MFASRTTMITTTTIHRRRQVGITSRFRRPLTREAAAAAMSTPQMGPHALQLVVRSCSQRQWSTAKCGL